jgi:hypothetical protein
MRTKIPKYFDRPGCTTPAQERKYNGKTLTRLSKKTTRRVNII